MRVLTNLSIGVSVVALSLAAGSAGWSAAPQENSGAEIPAAPAFSAKQLTDLPTANWVTNGGNVYNQR